MHYFDESLYLDIADTHGNTVDGAHIANVGGVWAGLVHGFAGVRDTGGHVRVAPRLPAGWSAMRFKLHRRGSDIAIALDPERRDGHGRVGRRRCRSWPAAPSRTSPPASRERVDVSTEQRRRSVDDERRP